MTQYNQTTLKTFFQTNDVPSGVDYGNFIDSCINAVNTGTQIMAGTLNPAELVTARVSATTIVCTGTFTAGLFSPTVISTSALTVGGVVSADSIVVNTTISAAGNIYAPQFNATTGFVGSVGIVSAAGIAQATAAPLIYTINRGAGITDGSTTGFALPTNKTGLTQYIINGAASANLWPPTGGAINALSSNAAFALAANTPYTILHVAASSYAVK